MKPLSWSAIACAIYLATVAVAHAEGCALSVEGTDAMRFNQDTLRVSSACKEVTVTLQHLGKQTRSVMGHDWVLAKTSDLNAIVNAGIAAGLANDYLQPGDRRVIAATRVIGGGESVSVVVPLSALPKGGDYSFFCTFPGHATVMRGKFIVEN